MEVSEKAIFRGDVYEAGLVRHIADAYGFPEGEIVPMESSTEKGFIGSYSFTVHGVGWNWSEDGGIARNPAYDGCGRAA